MGWSGSPELIECVFAANTAEESGGALWGEASLANCSLAGNTATLSGGGVFVAGAVTVANSILWENADANGNLESSQLAGGVPDVAFSCIQGWTGGWGGAGNHGLNPQFVEIGSRQLQLRPNSPCIDAGSNSLVPPDLDDLDSDADTAEMLPLTGSMSGV